MKEAIGKELEILRIRRNLELNDVANALFLNKETIRRYENKAQCLSVERLEQLLEFYDCDRIIFFKNVCENMHNK